VKSGSIYVKAVKNALCFATFVCMSYTFRSIIVTPQEVHIHGAVTPYMSESWRNFEIKRL